MKERLISDGELLHLLAPPSAINEDKAAAEIYASLVDLSDAVEKAAALYLSAALLALLAYFNVLERASAGGLEVARAAFRPIALIAWSASAFLLMARYTKLSYLRQWFDWRFQDDSGT